MVDSVDRSRVLAFRVQAQQLDRDAGTIGNTAVLDVGVQDSGPDGGLWALVNRGIDVSTLTDAELSTAWTIRGAPHIYRRSDLPAIAAAVEPFSDVDAGKRIFDATKPLKAAGIGNLEALDVVAAAMRSVVHKPMAKGEVSTALTATMDAPYLRFCRPCNATHIYEMPFRLAALRAGLELQAGTSPPVLQRIQRFRKAATTPRNNDVVRGYLRMLGPATPKQVADYLDSTVKEVKEHWPEDAVEVPVGKQTTWILDSDREALSAAETVTTRLLGPFDLFLQARDRPLLIADPARAKAMWPVLGRPGAVLLGGDVAGTWRPRKSGAKLTLAIELWARPTKPGRAAIEEQAQRLAAFRGLTLGGIDIAA